MSEKPHYLDSKMATILPPEGEIIEDINELAHTMGQVSRAAAEVDMAHLQPGFYGYQQVTRGVNTELSTGLFSYPDKMAINMPRFAQSAFDAMRHHVQGQPEKVGAWAPMYYSEAARRALPSTSMVDFLGFHVIYDLPYMLKATNTQEKHKEDYGDRINYVLGKVGQDLLPDYINLRPPFNQKVIANLGLNAVLGHLFRARDDAWSAFEEMEAAEVYWGGSLDEGSSLSQNAIGSHFTTQRPPRTLDQIDSSLRTQAARRMLSTKRAATFVLSRVSREQEHPWNTPSAA